MTERQMVALALLALYAAAALAGLAAADGRAWFKAETDERAERCSRRC